MYKIETAKIIQIPEIENIGKLSNIITYDYNYYMYFLTKFPDINFIIKNKENKIIGFILAQIKYKQDSNTNTNLTFPIGHVISFCILEEYRNQKLGTKLMNHLKKILKQQYKINQLYLEMEIGNRALSFYNRNGFIEHQILPNYYDDKDGVLLIWKHKP